MFSSMSSKSKIVGVRLVSLAMLFNFLSSCDTTVITRKHLAIAPSSVSYRYFSSSDEHNTFAIKNDQFPVALSVERNSSGHVIAMEVYRPAC